VFTAGRADEPLGDREQRRAFVETVKSSERQGLDNLFMAAAVAPNPNTLPQSGDVRERHALPGVILWSLMPGHGFLLRLFLRNVASLPTLPSSSSIGFVGREASGLFIAHRTFDRTGYVFFATPDPYPLDTEMRSDSANSTAETTKTT
jgi:hypothetical protein